MKSFLLDSKIGLFFHDWKKKEKKKEKTALFFWHIIYNTKKVILPFGK